MAGVAGFEPATYGFGDPESSCCSMPLGMNLEQSVRPPASISNLLCCLVSARGNLSVDNSVDICRSSPGRPRGVSLSTDPFRRTALPDKVRSGYTTSADITPGEHDWKFVGTATDTAEPMQVPRGKNHGRLQRGKRPDIPSRRARGLRQMGILGQ